LLPATLPEATGDSRDKAAASVGVGQKAIDKAVKILAEAPDIAAAVSSARCCGQLSSLALKPQWKSTLTSSLIRLGNHCYCRIRQRN